MVHMNGTCSVCDKPAIVIVNGAAWCMEHIDDAFKEVRGLIDRGLEVLNDPDERTM